MVRMYISHAYAKVGLDVYTVARMDNRPVVWDASDLRHLERDHPERGIGREEVEQVLDDPERLESAEARRSFTYHTVIGNTKEARLLVVFWIDHPEGRFPVHARQAGRAAARRYYR